jgi:hypothetical protein
MRHSLKTILPLARPLLLASALFGLGRPAMFAQAPKASQTWAYLLLHDSYLLDDCLFCDRISIPVPMRGTFNLRLIDETPISTRYALEDVNFTAGDRPYLVKGGGTFEISGEVAVTVRMSLELQIDDGVSNKVCYFTNSTSGLDRRLPMMDITVAQTNGTLGQVYSLRLAAAPVREIWFSTASSFKANAGPEASSIIEGGDLISTSGRIIKHNADLFTAVGAFPPVPDLGLDAVDILPGGEIAFSLESDITSNTLGLLQHGDLLSTQGRILRRNQDLLAQFGLQPPAPDVGLDAVHVSESADILFSIPTNVFSERLGVMLHRGDLLSTNGSIVRSIEQLLARFHPAKPTNDYGLDALYIWPSGEVWFSTEDAFDDSVLGSISSGDLLSDQGYIVFSNLELLKAFVVTNVASDVGLDALYIVTDAAPPAQPPRLAIQVSTSAGNAGVTWQGDGRVFQLERADRVAGPFQPLSPILPDLNFDDPGALTNRTQSYYRLRQW